MKTVLSIAMALASVSLFAVPASAGHVQGFTLNLDYDSGSVGMAGGVNGNIGGTIKKRTSESGSGSFNEVDIDVKLNKNGIKSVDGTVRSGAYAYNENMIRTSGPGAMGSGSISGSYVRGGSNVDLSVTPK